MNGNDLLSQYTSKRDYSNSPSDQYAQLLETIFFHIGKELFKLLEKAEKESKKLEVLDLTENGTILRDEIQLTDIILV